MEFFRKTVKRCINAVGNPCYSELLLFKILLLQTWYNLSDPKVEEAINDRISFTRFLDISVESEVPDHSTISRFRNSLVDNNLDKQLFLEINQQLVKKGILVKNGAIVDATIVTSSRRPRKVDELIVVEDRNENIEINKNSQVEEKSVETKIVTTYSADLEAKWIKKYGKYLYGYKIHNAVNDKGYILGGVITGANAADITHLEDVLNEIMLEEGLSVLADKGYPSIKNSELLESRNLVNKIMKKASKSRKLTEEEINENRRPLHASIF